MDRSPSMSALRWAIGQREVRGIARFVRLLGGIYAWDGGCNTNIRPFASIDIGLWRPRRCPEVRYRLCKRSDVHPLRIHRCRRFQKGHKISQIAFERKDGGAAPLCC
jgi:hypothetical protein